MKKLLVTIVISLISCICFANTPIKSFEEEYFDYLSLTGKAERSYLTYRTLTRNNYKIPENLQHNYLNSTSKLNNGIQISVYNPELFISENSQQPYGQNDGALWQGRGLNLHFTTGFTANYKGLSITLKPEICYSENKEYKTMKDTYGYFWGSMDLVQRYGNKPLIEFNFGDTNIRYTGKYLTAALGTEYLWTGPTYLNSVIMSNNAASYPKFEVGLVPTDTKIGKIELTGSLGILKTSDYFSKKPNNKSLLAMVSIGYQPSFIDTLTIGANYVVNFNYSLDSLKQMIKTVPAGNNIEGDGKMSYTLDWFVPSAGLEVYAEFGKDDYSYFNFYHTSVTQVGVKKSINLFSNKGLDLELIGEVGNMEMSRDAISQWSYNFYSHGDSLSYSNNGQLLGAGTGYAGVSWFLKINAFYKKGMSSIFAQLHHPDNNYTYDRLIRDYHTNKANWDSQHNAFQKFKRSLDIGLNTTFFLDENLTINGGVVKQIILNNYYQEDYIDSDDNRFKYYSNYNFTLGLTYNI